MIPFLLSLMLFSCISLHGMKPKNSASCPIFTELATNTLPDGRSILTTSRSPGDWHLFASRLADRPVLEKKEAEKRVLQITPTDILAAKIADHIAKDAIAVIYEILEELADSKIGDAQIDEQLMRKLYQLKKLRKTTNFCEEIIMMQPGEEIHNYKIRRNPEITYQMDKQVYKQALLVNKAIRIAGSE